MKIKLRLPLLHGHRPPFKTRCQQVTRRCIPPTTVEKYYVLSNQFQSRECFYYSRSFARKNFFVIGEPSPVVSPKKKKASFSGVDVVFDDTRAEPSVEMRPESTSFSEFNARSDPEPSPDITEVVEKEPSSSSATDPFTAVEKHFNLDQVADNREDDNEEVVSREPTPIQDFVSSNLQALSPNSKPLDVEKVPFLQDNDDANPSPSSPSQESPRVSNEVPTTEASACNEPMTASSTNPLAKVEGSIRAVPESPQREQSDAQTDAVEIYQPGTLDQHVLMETAKRRIEQSSSRLVQTDILENDEKESKIDLSQYRPIVELSDGAMQTERELLTDHAQAPNEQKDNQIIIKQQADQIKLLQEELALKDKKHQEELQKSKEDLQQSHRLTKKEIARADGLQEDLQQAHRLTQKEIDRADRNQEIINDFKDKLKTERKESEKKIKALQEQLEQNNPKLLKEQLTEALEMVKVKDETIKLKDATFRKSIALKEARVDNLQKEIQQKSQKLNALDKRPSEHDAMQVLKVAHQQEIRAVQIKADGDNKKLAKQLQKCQHELDDKKDENVQLSLALEKTDVENKLLKQSGCSVHMIRTGWI